MGYKTVKTSCEASFIEKKSEFIGYISPVTNEEEAIDFINKIKAMHRKATHNCYAYILRDNNTARHSDDGEPSGTAGVPIYDVLEKNGLTDVVVVVTRYFGGILLGAGGLVRAYSKSASLAVEKSGIVSMEDADKVKITFDYTFFGTVQTDILQYEGMIRDTEYGDKVVMIADIKSDKTESLLKTLTDDSAGKISSEIISHGFFEFK